jgi:aminoglycoside phosphotransferase (APT) family kinase protein
MAAKLDLGRDTQEARQAIVAIAQADEMRLTGRSRTGHDSYAESGAGTKAAASKVQAPFDAAALQAYLRARPDGDPNLEVETLRPLPGGFSKSTYLADIRRDGVEEGWVLRRDLPFSPLRTFVPDEYPLLQALHARGFPVAQPLWCEADPGALGAATLAVLRVAGDGDMTAWSGDAPRAAAIGVTAAKLAAALHALDPATLPPLQTGAPGALAGTPALQLDHLRAFWLDKRIAPNPLVELVFGWLAAHLPQPTRRGLVHGDFGLHNLIVDGEEIAALLDWEFAHLGDPQEDLAYGRPFISRMMDWEAFVDAYVAAGGARPDPAALDYYTVFGTFRNALGCFNVLHAVRHRLRTIDSKFAYVGRAYANALLLEAARTAGIA